MSAAALASLASQLAALLRARRAVSASQRRESPVPWWVKRVLIVAGAFSVVLGSFLTSIAIAGDPDVDPQRASVLYFLGPAGVAVLLMASRLRPDAAVHPLGEARFLLPLGRWRSAALATGEEVFSLETAFIIALGWAPWMGAFIAGDSWLNTAGWLSALSAPAVAVSLRQLLLAIQSWVTMAAEGSSAAVLRVAFVLLFVGLPWFLRILGRPFNVTGIDPFALPLLRWANGPFSPAAILAAAAAMVALSAFIRSRRRPSWLRPLRHGIKFPSFAPRAISFDDGRPVLVMFRMMVVQAFRLPACRYSLLILLVSAGLAIATSVKAFGGVTLVAAFHPPIFGLYNLYGADSRHYVLWMASGRSLREWTAARQLFFATYYAFGAVITLAVIALTTTKLRPAQVAGVIPAAAIALLVALIVGPAVSRFVLAPHQLELGRQARAEHTGRLWVSTTCLAATGVIAASLGAGADKLGLWWANWVIAGLLALVFVATRPGRARWTWALRDRMASAFRG